MRIDNHFMVEGPCIPKEEALKAVARARRRLQRSSIADLPCSQELPKNHNDRRTNVVLHEQIEIGCLLGEGSFSQVYEIKSIQKQKTDKLVLKVLKSKLLENPRLFASCSSDLVREGLLLSRLNHPNVLSCRASSPNGIDAYAEGRSASFFLVLERLDCTLKEKLEHWRRPMNMVGLAKISAMRRQRPEDSLEERIRYTVELAKAVEYLHSQRVFHRDLKPANIGVDHEGCLKLFDLDSCRILPKEAMDDPDELFRFTKEVGSPRYMAPEIALGDYYNAKGDVYSFGLIMWELLSLRVPYADVRADHQREEVFYRGHRPECPQSWPSCVKNLLHQCWNRQVRLRPTMAEVTAQIEGDLKAMKQGVIRRGSDTSLGRKRSRRRLMSLPNFLSSQ